MTETNKETIAQFEYRGYVISIREIKPKNEFDHQQLEVTYCLQDGDSYLVPRSQFASVQSARREAEQEIDFDIAENTIGDRFIAFWQQHRAEGISSFDIIYGIASGAGGLANRSSENQPKHQNDDPLIRLEEVLRELLKAANFNI